MKYTWGALGEKRALTYFDGKKVTYNYDELYRLTSVEDIKGKVYYHYNEHGLFLRCTSDSLSMTV